MVSTSLSIREIVSANHSAAAVLERFHIDLCLNGDTPLDEACAELQLSVEQVLEKLSDAAAAEAGVPQDLSTYSSRRLIQHIVRTYHGYLRRELPHLAEMASMLAESNGRRAPELVRLGVLVDQLRKEILAHIRVEEQVLFPRISMLEEARDQFDPGDSAVVTEKLARMGREHDSAERLVSEIRTITHDFTVPADACGKQAALYKGLEALAHQLRDHLNIEDGILFPRVTEMESQFSVRRQS